MRTREIPWWLAGGTEECPFCLQRHAIEVEVRCEGCDRGLCSHCVARVRLREEVWCPDCAPRATEPGG